MPNTFAFKVASTDGTFDSGRIDADSLDEARALLRGRGLFVLEVVDRGPTSARRERLRGADLALGLRILADLLNSGLPVARALTTFEELAPKAWRHALPSIHQSIKQGSGLADALASAPLEFPPLIVGIVHAGEAGGEIATAIRRAADLTDQMVETRSAIHAALIYPAVVAVAGLAAIVVLVTVVLPRFAAILADLGQELPTSTRLVMRIASVARMAILPISILSLLIAFVAMIAFDRPGGKRWRDRMLLRIPLIGTIRRGSAVARMAQSLATLLASGVPLSAALSLARHATGDAELSERLSAARTAVTNGASLSRALADADAATATTVRLARAGEETGRLSAMLEHAAHLERQITDRTVRTLVRLIEPTLLLVFASIVAFVAAALLQAIYSVRPGAS